MATGWIYLVLALLTIAVYWPLHTAEFNNYDDQQYILDNPQIQGGLTRAAVAWAFTTGYAGNWHPLTWLSHCLDCQWFGLHAGGHHVVNVLFHTANTLLLFAVWRSLTGTRWRAAAVAALFAWHPLHVESVAWVAERKDVLSGLFWWLALGAYGWYARTTDRRARGWAYAALLGAFVLGLMAKPMVVTLPGVLLLLDFWPLRRWTGAGAVPAARLVFEKLPLLALSAGASVVTYLVQQQGGAFGDAPTPLGARLANAVVAYVRYLGKLAWPADLAVFYPFNPELPTLAVAGAGLGLLAITGFALGNARRQPWWIMGWLWFLGTLVPVIGIVKVGGQALADRYTYLPATGVFIAVVWGAAEWAGDRERRRRALGVVAAVAAAACLGLTRRQGGYWHDSVALFQHAIDATGRNSVAEYNLGQALLTLNRMAEAAPHFQAASEIDPTLWKAQNNWGLCLARMDRLTEATNHYATAIQLAPTAPDAHFNLGVALTSLGNRAGAAAQFQDYVQLAPNDSEGHRLLGGSLAASGRATEAQDHLARAAALNPTNPPTLLEWGMVLSQAGRLPEAAARYEDLLRLAPQSVEGLNNLAWLRATCPVAELRNGAQAVRLAEQVCELTGRKIPLLLGTLGAAYAEAGRFGEAAATARQAASLAEAAGLAPLAARNRELAALYESGRPWHEPPVPAP